MSHLLVLLYLFVFVFELYKSRTPVFFFYHLKISSLFVIIIWSLEFGIFREHFSGILFHKLYGFLFLIIYLYFYYFLLIIFICYTMRMY
jgi:hypothetical protein